MNNSKNLKTYPFEYCPYPLSIKVLNHFFPKSCVLNKVQNLKMEEGSKGLLRGGGRIPQKY